MNLGLILLVLASIAVLAAWIWLIVVAFRNNLKMWGILLIVSIFLPILGPLVCIVFLILQWSIARRPGILMLAALGVEVVAFVLLLGTARFVARQAEELAALQAARRDVISSAPAEAAEPPPPLPPQPPPRESAEARSTPPPAPALAAVADGAPSTGSKVPAQINSQASLEMPSPATNPPSPSYLDPRFSPVRVELLSLGDPRPNRMRALLVRAGNAADKPVRELKLELVYVDARGLRLGRWTTVHSSTGTLVAGKSTNDFDFQAFFVPQFTRDIRLEVEAVGFADGSRWP